MLLTNILKKAYKIKSKPSIRCICSWEGSINTQNTCLVCVFSFLTEEVWASSCPSDLESNKLLLNKNYFLRWLQTKAREEIPMLSTINMEACQGYQFEDPRFLPWPPELGVSQPPSEAHKNKIKLSWKTHSSHTTVSWYQGLDSSRSLMCSIVKMKGERRVPKHWKKQNTTVSQLSFQTNFCRLKVWAKTTLCLSLRATEFQSLHCWCHERGLLWTLDINEDTQKKKSPLEAPVPALLTHPWCSPFSWRPERWEHSPATAPAAPGQKQRVRMAFLHTTVPPAAQHCALRAEHTREGRTVDFQRITGPFRLQGTLKIDSFFQYSCTDYLQVTDSNWTAHPPRPACASRRDPYSRCHLNSSRRKIRLKQIVQTPLHLLNPSPRYSTGTQVILVQTLISWISNNRTHLLRKFYFGPPGFYHNLKYYIKKAFKT